MPVDHVAILKGYKDQAEIAVGALNKAEGEMGSLRTQRDNVIKELEPYGIGVDKLDATITEKDAALIAKEDEIARLLRGESNAQQ